MRSKSSTNFILSIIALAGMFLIGLGIYKLVDKPPAKVDMNITTTTNPNEKSITVDPRRVWSDTGIQIKKGQTVNISASGQINLATKGEGGDKLIGPEGWGYIPLTYCGGAPCRYIYRTTESMGSLIGKIGKGEPFNIGASATITARDNGSLYLSVNDAVSDGNGRMLSDSEAASLIFSNNSGSFTATISVSGGGKSITVDARHDWTNTGIEISKGQEVSISASGKVVWKNVADTNPNARPKPYEECGPDGTPPVDAKDYYSNIASYQTRNANKGALIGKIGENGIPFKVGSSLNKTMDESGVLYLGINEMRPEVDSTAYADNQGSFSVVVEVK